MDGWTDGWMNKRMDERMGVDGLMGGRMIEDLKDGWLYG